MGKIRTEGRVTLEFEPDVYEITLTVRAKGENSGAAVTDGKQQTEALLHSLQDELGIKPEEIAAENENVSVPYNGESYHYVRDLMLTIPADNHVRERVTNLLRGMENVTYSVQERLSDESKQKQAALDAALQCARSKAVQLASSMHCRVVDFEEISMDEMRQNEEFRGAKASNVFAKTETLASDLKLPKIKVNGVVTVVWLTEPLT